MKVGEPETDTASRSGVPHINTVGVKGGNCVATAAVLTTESVLSVASSKFVCGWVMKLESSCVRSVRLCKYAVSELCSTVTSAGNSLRCPVLLKKTHF
jgi:hypothetical protein